MNIYKKIACDFGFIREFGLVHTYELRHYVYPSIVFCNNGVLRLVTEDIRIGMNYEERKMYAIIYIKTKEGGLHGYDILHDINLNGSTYEEQVEQVKKIVQDYIVDIISQDYYLSKRQ